MDTTALDPLLRQFAECAGDAAGEALLARLVLDHAQPAVRRIVRYKLAFQGSTESQDVDDVTAEVVVELVGRLRELRTSGQAGSIGDFGAYAAVAAYHACNEYLRRKYPNRHRLKNRLRYLLNTDKAFALWNPPGCEWICGHAAWQTSALEPVGRERTAQWREILHDIPRGQYAHGPGEWASRVFDRFGGPVEFDDLVEIAAEMWGIEDVPLGGEREAVEVPSADSDIASRVEQKQWLTALWTEMRDLPYGQRNALLLNLRLPQGGSAILLLPATGIAPFRAIAEALGMTPAELAELWNSLPLDDNTIAERLGVTRQQVINYRKSARERLTRRMTSRARPGSRGNNLEESTST